MSTIIKIKNSGVSGSPSALATGELAYSYLTGTLSNGGERLYIGTGTEDSQTGAAANIEVIGGTYFTSKLDHTPGTLTASSAVIVDSNNKIDIFNVDNLRLDGNTLSSTNANGDINLTANGTGDINLSTVGDITLTATNLAITGLLDHTGDIHATGTLNVDGQSTLASLNVEDLTATRVVYVGANGELVDSSDMVFTGSGATSQLQLIGKLNVDAQTTLASLNVEDLTAGRVTFAGTSGELVDSNNFTFNTSTNNLVLTGDMDITGSLDVDGLSLNGNTLASTTTNTDMTIQTNGTGRVVMDINTAFRIPYGTDGTRPAPIAAGEGAIRYNSTTMRFEGVVSSGSGLSWAGLGGVIDVDQNTYIIAETTPGANNNDLEFYTDGVKRVNLDENGMVFTDTSIPLQVGKIKILGDTISTTTGGVMYLDPNPTGSAGSVVIEGNLTINGTTTTVNSTVVTVDDPIFILGGDTSLSAPDGMDKGILFQWHNGTSAKQGFFGYDSSDARFTFIEDATNASEVISGAAANVKFGNTLLNSMTFTSGNYLNTSVMGVNGSGDVVFYNEDSSSVYGVTGQVLQMNSSGVPSFGHIDCGTY